MKVLFSFLAFGILTFLSCKKESAPEPIGWCGTLPGRPVLPDTTQYPPQNPDSSARVATVTEQNAAGESYTRQLFYGAGELVDSVVCTGSKAYVQRFKHTPDYTVSRAYDGGSNVLLGVDSIRLNAAGYPAVMYQMRNDTDTVQLLTTFKYDAAGYLTSRNYDYVPNRYNRTVYYTWDAGDLVSYNDGGGNTTAITLYTYFLLNPAMPGEPQNLEPLFETGRPLKQAAHLRISTRNATEREPTMIVYSWEKGRIVSWLKNGGTTTTARLTYYT